MFSKLSFIVLLTSVLVNLLHKYDATTVAAFTVTGNTVTKPFTTTITQPRSPTTIITTTRIYAGPAILEPPVKENEVIEKVNKEEKVESKSSHKRGGWAVRLFNDPMNKREFVAMCLSKIVGLSDGQAYQVMMQAHQNGIGIVGRFDLERAELYKSALIDNGLTCDMIPVDDE
jgi:ATP-dependent Clp protease adaptor protein ClpS